MKIAVNTRLLVENNMEGVGWFSTEVLKRMTVNHPGDTFYFLFDRPYSEKFIFSENVIPLVLPPQARHPFLWTVWFEWSIPRALNKIRPDVFLTPDTYCSLRTDVPTTSVVHDLAFEHFPEHVPWLVRNYYRYFWPKFVKKADRIVTVSEYTRQDVHQQYGVPLEKMDVACNGARPEFHPLNERKKDENRQRFSRGKPYFVYVGSIHPRKNVGRLIDAFSNFKQRTGAPHRLILAGRKAWMSGDVDRAMRSSSFAADIDFLGYTGNTLPDIIASADAMVYVSLFEGFGIPILEAMHCEIPVITSNVSSMPEVAGDAALLVDPTDINAITEAMITLFESPDIAHKLVERGKEQRVRFTWEKASDVVYKNIIESTGVAYPHE